MHLPSLKSSIGKLELGKTCRPCETPFSFLGSQSNQQRLVSPYSHGLEKLHPTKHCRTGSRF